MRDAEAKETIALSQSSPERAIPLLERCLDRDPDNPDLLRAMVMAKQKSGAPVTDVEPYSSRWCSAQPNDPAAWRTRMDVLIRLSRYPEAAAAGERAIALDPDTGARTALASLYLTMGRYGDAANLYRQLLASSSGSDPLLVAGLARAEWECGHDAEAARLMDQLLSSHPTETRFIILRGLIHARAGEHDRVIALFKGLRPTASSERETVLYHLALAHERSGHPTEARAVFQKLAAFQNAARYATDAQQRPDDAGLQVRAAEAFLAADEPAKARQIALGSLTRNGPSRELLTVLARAYEAAGQNDLAAQTRARMDRLP
jgi:predicted Zn-dependent protease